MCGGETAPPPCGPEDQVTPKPLKLLQDEETLIFETPMIHLVIGHQSCTMNGLIKTETPSAILGRGAYRGSELIYISEIDLDLEGYYCSSIEH